MAGGGQGYGIGYGLGLGLELEMGTPNPKPTLSRVRVRVTLTLTLTLTQKWAGLELGWGRVSGGEIINSGVRVSRGLGIGVSRVKVGKS